MSFEKLLSDLDDLQALQKSAPADENLEGEVGEGSDDSLIADAAAEGEVASEAEGSGEGSGEGEGHAEPDADDVGGPSDGDADNEVMGKSFRFTLDTGEEMEAVDGTELVKSLMARFDTNEESMTKALGVAVDLIKSQGDLIKSQGEAIASLQTEVTRISGEGRGRKTVVSVAEKPTAETMAKSEPAGISGEEFMAKAMDAQKAGRLTALQISVAETALIKGLAVPADIVKRVLV